MLVKNKLAAEPLIRAILAVGKDKFAHDNKIAMNVLDEEITRLSFLYDSASFAENTLKIMDKFSNLIPFKYNPGQLIIEAAKVKQISANKPVRLALLKARQFGGSTLEEGDVFRECILRPGRSTMIIAHDLDSARHLREMSHRFYENFTLSKPRLKKETDKWWKFLHRKDGKPFESNLRIDTAEELSTGHSLTLQHLHLSEIQNWRNATVLVKGLFPTVPNSPDTTIFMEGTGSGVGDYWYDFCQMAMNPTSEWEFVFVPWYKIEDYSARFANEDERQNFIDKMDSEEKLLYGDLISAEQLLWRRTTISNTYKGDIESFRQQYPATADEAFLTSGRPVFSPIKVREAAKRAKPARLGNLVWKKDKVEFVEESNGIWDVWEDVDKSKENLYALGADVAEGIAVQPEFGNKGGDFSCAKILRRDKMSFVGRLHARIDPDLFADEIHKAWEYWRCGVLVENNPGGSGNVVIRDLKDISGINLLKTVTLDRIHDTRKEQYGWDTNQQSKREMIDELVELIREVKFSDPSENFWYEAATYIKDEKGRTNAQSRKYDDEVVATAIAIQADKLMSSFYKPLVEEKKVYTRDMDVPQNFNQHITQDSVMEENYVYW